MIYIEGMTVRAFAFVLALCSAILAATKATAAHDIGVVPQGRYQCALPGDAEGRAYVAMPDLSFRISSASRYSHVSGKGVYLFDGHMLIFTRGPLKDMRLRRIPGGLFQQVKSDGTPGRVRCNRIAR